MLRITRLGKFLEAKTAIATPCLYQDLSAATAGVRLTCWKYTEESDCLEHHHPIQTRDNWTATGWRKWPPTRICWLQLPAQGDTLRCCQLPQFHPCLMAKPTTYQPPFAYYRKRPYHLICCVSHLQIKPFCLELANLIKIRPMEPFPDSFLLRLDRDFVRLAHLKFVARPCSPMKGNDDTLNIL